MKFTKFGKALLMSALSAGVVVSVTSCVQSYSVGFLYVTGSETAQSSANGIISGYKIDHNTGKLTAINGLPVASGGANPERAVLLTGSRFLYVLNRGLTASGSANCTTADPCLHSNITQFAVGGEGILTPQETFYTQGINPFRLLTDSTGGYLFVLDHDSPAPTSTAAVPVAGGSQGAGSDDPGCAQALGGVATCGDITVFKVDGTTGRLSLVVNAQVTSASGTALPYFPVPANPVDISFAGSSIITMSGTASSSFPYIHGTSVFPYNWGAGSGQLTISQSTPQALGINEGTALSYTGGDLYVMDNEPYPGAPKGTSQILPYTVAASGTLQPQLNGAVADTPTQSNPVIVLQESKSKWLYVANAGNLTDVTNGASGIDGFSILTPFQLTELPGAPFGSGSGPKCMVEDPSDQFIYTANFNDSSVTGRLIEANSGILKNLSWPGVITLPGQPTWCLVDGRTS
jgi:6-phosphogluconolactonase (cycloisomerase 2 family)